MKSEGFGLRSGFRSLQSRLNKLESQFQRLASREKKNQNDLLESIKSMEEKMNSCLICKHAASESPKTNLDNVPSSVKIRVESSRSEFHQSRADDISGFYQFVEVVNDRAAYKVCDILYVINYHQTHTVIYNSSALKKLIRGKKFIFGMLEELSTINQ